MSLFKGPTPRKHLMAKSQEQTVESENAPPQMPDIEDVDEEVEETTSSGSAGSSSGSGSSSASASGSASSASSSASASAEPASGCKVVIFLEGRQFVYENVEDCAVEDGGVLEFTYKGAHYNFGPAIAWYVKERKGE